MGLTRSRTTPLATATRPSVTVRLINNTTGFVNIAVGYEAGFNLTTGSGNIDIGNGGIAGEANTISIGDLANE